jgi:hypothetical protein
MVDVGREILIPQAMLEGKVLYRDILNLYGPLAYEINALLFLIFGVKLNTLYAAGAMCSLIFIYSIYAIAREFTSQALSTTLTATIIAMGMFNPSLHNFLLPYTFAVTYGICAYVISTLCLIKYIKTQKPVFAILASLACGFAVSCKSDFFLLPLVLAAAILINGRKDIFKCIGAFAVFPLLSLGILLLQGWGFNDFAATSEFLKRFLSTDVMTLHQKNAGLYPCTQGFTYMFFDFIKTAVLFLLYRYCFKFQGRVVKIFAALALILITFFATGVNMFSFLPMLMLVILIVDFKRLDKPLFWLMTAALCATMKTFFYLFFQLANGVYTFPLIFTAFVIYLAKRTKMDKFLIFSLIILLCANSIFVLNVKQRQKVQGAADYIYAAQVHAPAFTELINYINENTAPEDIVLFYPEGSMINYLTNRQTDMKCYILHEHFTQTIGINQLIEHIKHNNVKYIVFVTGFLTPKHQPSGEDRATFRKFLEQNYKLTATFGNEEDKFDFFVVK